MKRYLAILFGPVVLGLLLVVVLISAAAAAPPDPEPPGIQINGLFWGDGDYTEYYPIANSSSAGLGTLFGALISPTRGAVLAKISHTLNDNALKKDYDSYLGSVGWDKRHGLKELERSDMLALNLECGPNKYQWEQNLLKGSMDSYPNYGWHSPIENFVVLSGTEILADDLILEAHSSTEYNVIHSSWISINQIVSNSLQNSEYWTSPDLQPFDTISLTVSPDDIGAMTQVHEDYPFFMSTGAGRGDLWEWEISYEMLIDTSVCGANEIYVEVVSGHNSPDKGGGDVIIPPVPVFSPTALEMQEITTAAGNATWMYVVVGFVLLSATTLYFSRRMQTRRNK